MDGGMQRRTVLKGAALGTAAALVPGASTAMAAKKRKREGRYDAIVVGGGMAGLYAARTLRRAGKRVVLLEANDRLGGRVVNLKVGPRADDVMEGGAQWISPSQPLIQGLMKQYKLKTYKNYDTGKTSLSLNGQVASFDGIIAPLPGDAAAQLLGGFSKLTSMAATVPIDGPWNAPQAEAWDNMTCQDWVEGNVSDEAARALLEIAMGGPVSVQARDVSLLHYLFVAQASGGPLGLVTLGQGVLSDRVVGGTGAIVAGLGRELHDIVELKTPATMIEHGRNQVRVTTPHGVHVADDVVLAMAPTMTQQLLFDPMLPVPRVQSVQRAGMGSAIKFFPVYETPFWRQAGLSGYVQSVATPGNPLPAFGACFDNSPPSGKPGVLFCLSENVVARRMSMMSPAARKAEILDALVPIFGEQARHPVGFVEQDWSAEPWIRGGACSFFPTGLLTEYRYLFGTPIGRLHFASTESGGKFWGNMEAALGAGQRAAQEILGRR